MNSWMTIVIGGSVGLLWRRVVLANRSGGFTDMLLGTTGAFGASWLLDLLRQHGVNADPYGPVFIVCGAALLPWSFHEFGRANSRAHPSERFGAPRTDSRTAESQTDASRTRSRAA